MASRIALEARQTGDGARRQLATSAPAVAELARRLRAHPPPLVVTCARGSSDHAATYGKYVIETTVGRLVASVGPSVASMYQRVPAGMAGALFVAASQSGRSPDVLELTEAAKRGGALVLGLVNDETSPLAALCDLVLPLCAGEERAVAATKSFLLSGLAFLQLAAAWTGDAALVDAVARAPDTFDAACDVAWDLSPLAGASSLYVVGRGVGLGPAQELALKLKETCRLHAEAFSTAEVLHGPVALVGPGFPIVAVEQPDATAATTRDVLDRLVALGATIHRCTPPADSPPLLAPLCQVQSFYLALPALAAARGLDADAPPHLTKVTHTR
ncbi:MAG TPA: SIS domain-containing protein [Kofleriaceae bacterium]|nr:SIS domain-containing protein [Kofleriaceae bacterium]